MPGRRQRLKTPGRAEQQPSGVGGAALRQMRSVRAGDPPRRSARVRRAGLDRDQQPSAASSAPASRLVRAAASRRCARQTGFGRQHRRALEERGRRGQTPAGLRPAGRALEFPGDVLVGPGRGLRPVPGAAVGIGLRVGGLRQRAVHVLSSPEATPSGRPRSAPADGGTAPARRTRAARPRPPAWPPRHRSRAARLPAIPVPGRRAARPPRPAAAAGSAAGRASEPPPEALLDAPRERRRAREPNPPASSAGVRPRAAAPTAPAGCRASRRRSGRGPAHPAAR